MVSNLGGFAISEPFTFGDHVLEVEGFSMDAGARLRNRRIRGTLTLLVFYGAFAASFAAMVVFIPVWQYGKQAPESQKPDLQDRHVGTILVPQRGGDCRQLRFDNVTGLLQDDGVIECDRKLATDANSTPGRMKAIRDAFSKN